TGRTHQIRVHLQFLGYPIANDPLYCNKEVWGESLGRNGVFPKYDRNLKDADAETAEEKTSQEAADGSNESRPKMSGQRDTDNIEPWMDLVKRMEEWKTKQELIEEISNSVDTQGVPRVCDKCTDPVLPDPKPEELCIWLHAWRYSGPGWSYETPLPAWSVEAKEHIEKVKYIPEKTEQKD
ncbi:DRAP deaminase, partial [Coemansia sp. RSA 486]